MAKRGSLVSALGLGRRRKSLWSILFGGRKPYSGGRYHGVAGSYRRMGTGKKKPKDMW
jgi:hypothetical protein